MALLLIGAVLFADAASFVRLLAGLGIRVDDNPLAGFPLALGVSLFVIGLAVASGIYVRQVWRTNEPGPELRRIVILTLAMAGVAFFMMPMLSNDLYSVLAFGELALRGFNPYTQYGQLAGSPLYSYIGAEWKAIPCPYGPLCVLAAMASVAIGGPSIIAQIAIFKIFTLLAGCSLIAVVAAVIGKQEGSRRIRNAALILLSPVLWLQATGQAHTDIFVALWAVVIIWLCSRRAFLWAGAIAGLSLATKLTALIILPYAFFVLYAMVVNDRRDIASFARTAAAMGLLAMAIMAIFYAPFWDGLDTLREPWRYVSAKAPLNSAPYIISEGSFYLFGGLQLLTHASSPLLDKALYEPFLVNLFKAASLAACLVFVWQARRAKTHIEVTDLYLKISTVAVCFFYPEFHTWYLMLPLCFMLFTENEAWIRWGIAVTTFDNLLNVTRFFDPSTAAAMAISAVVTVLAVLLLFYKIRERFRPDAPAGHSSGSCMAA
jgi:hypothetical protein